MAQQLLSSFLLALPPPPLLPRNPGGMPYWPQARPFLPPVATRVTAPSPLNLSYLAARIWPRLHTAMGLKKVEAEDEEGNPCLRAAAEDSEEERGAAGGAQ